MWAIVVPLWHCYRLLGGFCGTGRRVSIRSLMRSRSGFGCMVTGMTSLQTEGVNGGG